MGKMNILRKWGRKGCAMLVVLLSTAMLFGCAATRDRPPQLTASSELQYPAEAKASGIEGNVVVRYDITEAGEIADAEVLFADPPGVFDEAALALVRSFRFRPAMSKGVAVRVPGRTSTITFKLDDGAYADH